jgi:probable HAF family extracellular repeat protein
VIWEGDDIADLGVLDGTTGSEAWDINERGQVVGACSAAGDRADRAFVWRDGEMDGLIGFGGPGSAAAATSINDVGQIAGGSFTAADPATAEQHAALWLDGKALVHLATLPDGRESHAWDINEAGLVVGVAQNSDGTDRAVLWSDGQPMDLGTLGGADAGASAVNKGGQIAGAARTRDGALQAFVWSDGAMTGLGTLPGSRHSRALDINDRGHVVGVAIAPSFEQNRHRAVLWRDRAVIDLNTVLSNAPEWELTTARGINGDGIIVGEGVVRGSKRAFVLTPIIP